MPYSIKKKGSDFAVIKTADGSTVPGGRHLTQEKAEAHLKALFANVKSTDNSLSDMNKEILKCRASGSEIKVSQPWKQGEQASFCYMPAGVHNITAGFRGKAINITVNVHEGTANKVQASFESLKAEAPRQHPFGDIEHDEKEASFHPVNFSWGDHLGEQGVICSCEPTSLGERNVNGKIHRSFSPSFATDADYSKAKLQDGVYTFPEGVRGSQTNPAEVIGIDFCVGTLTNKPAFRAMPPVKAKNMKNKVKAAAEKVADQPAPSSADYADLAKKAEFKTAVAKAADKIFPEGEAHGKKFHLHTEAAMAQKAAAETCEDEDCKAEHQECADEHLASAEEHGKIIAKDESKDETVIKAEAASEEMKATQAAYDASCSANEASDHADENQSERTHKAAMKLHAEASSLHDKASEAHGDSAHADLHDALAKFHDQKSAEHKAASEKKDDKVESKTKLTSDSVFASIKASKPAPVKIADSQSILASLARAKSN